jgi:hypothetical protein
MSGSFFEVVIILTTNLWSFLNVILCLELRIDWTYVKGKFKIMLYTPKYQTFTSIVQKSTWRDWRNWNNKCSLINMVRFFQHTKLTFFKSMMHKQQWRVFVTLKLDVYLVKYIESLRKEFSDAENLILHTHTNYLTS